MIFRTAFFLLVLVNLLFLTWTQGYWGSFESGHEPHRMGQQLNAEKLLISPQPVAPTVTEIAPVAALASAVMEVPAKPDAQGCQRLTGLTEAVAQSLRQAAEATGWQARLLQGEGTLFLVVIPELANQAAAEKKAGELQRRGVTEFTLVAYANQRHEIQFGSFRDEPSAKAFLAALNLRGVNTARVAQRAAATLPPVLEVRGPREALEEKLPALLAPHAGINRTGCDTPVP